MPCCGAKIGCKILQVFDPPVLSLGLLAMFLRLAQPLSGLAQFGQRAPRRGCLGPGRRPGSGAKSATRHRMPSSNSTSKLSLVRTTGIQFCS
jgi:hypothetical protein